MKTGGKSIILVDFVRAGLISFRRRGRHHGLIDRRGEERTGIYFYCRGADFRRAKDFVAVGIRVQ